MQLRTAPPMPTAEGPSVLSLVLETALDGVIVMRADGDVVDWNQQAEIIFGWSRAEAIGRPLAELVIPEPLRAAHWAGLNRYLVTGQALLLRRRIEVSAIRKSGEEFPVARDGLAVLPPEYRRSGKRRGQSRPHVGGRLVDVICCNHSLIRPFVFAVVI